MKKIIAACLIAAAMSFAAAKTVTVEICQPTFCYDVTYSDVSKTEFRTDANGRKFLRIYFTYGNLVDLSGAEIKLKRKK